ncbi:hypothetical protein CXR04_09650 [Streptomyces sp. CMB-StM0423]|nr:hypothetical protein CXR04_09650 [Streptomyces sp. CMB-StM0423]
MIPAGRRVVDDYEAAAMMGIARGTLRNTQAWKPLAAAVVSRGRTRLYDHRRLRQLLAGETPEPLPTTEDEKDLLDVEEARQQIPTDRLLAASTWRSYICDGTGPPPDTTIAGVPFWYRATLPAWLANRSGRGTGGGRPAGTPDTRPRTLTADRHQLANQRRVRVRDYLTTRPRPTSADLTELAAELGISPRHARRLAAEARDG